jgi:hypothetical protein
MARKTDYIDRLKRDNACDKITGQNLKGSFPVIWKEVSDGKITTGKRIGYRNQAKI